MHNKTIYFVRHGEAAGNSGGFSQTASTPLTETGHQQAKKVAERFTNLPVDVVLASTMDRAKNTAQYIAKQKNLTVEITEYFHEFTKPASVQGASHDSEEYQLYMKNEAEHYTDPTWRFEDGENFSDVLKRVSDGVDMLEKRAEDHLVVVSHGRLLRFLTSYLIHQRDFTADIEYKTSTSFYATNTGITVFTFQDGKWQLLTWNDHAHFAE